jgi:hypothetical protein
LAPPRLRGIVRGWVPTEWAIYIQRFSYFQRLVSKDKGAVVPTNVKPAMLPVDEQPMEADDDKVAQSV